jgi:hypothetical protein
MVIGFIDHLLLETTNQYNILADFHTTNPTTLNLISLFSLAFVAALNNVFTVSFLTTDVNAVTRSVIKLYTPNVTVTTAHV